MGDGEKEGGKEETQGIQGAWKERIWMVNGVFARWGVATG